MKGKGPLLHLFFGPTLGLTPARPLKWPREPGPYDETGEEKKNLALPCGRKNERSADSPRVETKTSLPRFVLLACLLGSESKV